MARELAAGIRRAPRAGEELAAPLTGPRPDPAPASLRAPSLAGVSAAEIRSAPGSVFSAHLVDAAFQTLFAAESHSHQASARALQKRPLSSDSRMAGTAPLADERTLAPLWPTALPARPLAASESLARRREAAPSSAALTADEFPQDASWWGDLRDWPRRWPRRS
jgi:hypothetical protein